jgi:hypothetical protein
VVLCFLLVYGDLPTLFEKLNSLEIVYWVYTEDRTSWAFSRLFSAYITEKEKISRNTSKINI